MHKIHVFDIFLSFLLSDKMDKNTNEWNKSKRLKEKNYLERFNKLSVYSYVRNDKVCLGVKPEEISELFYHACGRERCSIDQSVIQYYMILGLQDFYQNHFLPLRGMMKEELEKTQTMLINLKKKNDERYYHGTLNDNSRTGQ